MNNNKMSNIIFKTIDEEPSLSAISATTTSTSKGHGSYGNIMRDDDENIAILAP